MPESPPAAQALPGVAQDASTECALTPERAQGLVRRVLSSHQLAELIDHSPPSVRDSMDEVDRRRTLQLNLYRIGAWGIGGCIGFAFRPFTGRVWWLALALAALAALFHPLYRRVARFRALNAFAFAVDLVLTEIVIWQFGVVVTHAIFWLPAILIAMAFYLPTRSTVALWTFAMLQHLGVIFAQSRGLLPVSGLATRFGLPEAYLRNPRVAEAAIGFTLFVLPVSLAFALRLVRLIRQREYELAGANDVIARYVPAQLAERIFSGEHVADAPPDRRKLTVFFSDIAGFTETTDQLEAEDLSRILNEYLSEMAAIAEAHGGTIDKFVGDAIMVFFGAPVPTTDQDHALRAVRMAREMQRRMRELSKKWFEEGIPVPFRVRIGINTGPASVGSFGSAGRMDYTAIGNQVNLAARLESECAPGRVLISHSTWALVREEIPCVEKGEIEVKGIHYPVKVYEVADAASPDSEGATEGG